MINLRSWPHFEVEIASLDPDYDCNIGKLDLEIMNSLMIFSQNFRRR